LRHAVCVATGEAASASLRPEHSRASEPPRPSSPHPPRRLGASRAQEAGGGKQWSGRRNTPMPGGEARRRARASPRSCRPSRAPGGRCAAAEGARPRPELRRQRRSPPCPHPSRQSWEVARRAPLAARPRRPLSRSASSQRASRRHRARPRAACERPAGCAPGVVSGTARRQRAAFSRTSRCQLIPRRAHTPSRAQGRRARIRAGPPPSPRRSRRRGPRGRPAG
jgi:hypothetical protein